MEISWFGHTCFRLQDRILTVVCDPYDGSVGMSLPRLTADVVTISHGTNGHSNAKGVKNWRKVLSGPGEYEIEGVFITGIPTYHGTEESDSREPNTVFLFEYPDLNICHLGDLGHILKESEVEALPNIDVLMVPVGGRHTLDAAKAAEVISIIEPAIVIPMHFLMKTSEKQLESVDRFLKEMGVPAPEPIGSLKLTKKSQLPSETQVLLLTPRQ
ncbi:MAG: MBL fold metallo-hydrolase [Chloroflexota bacterium]|nr:MBL fold metallo-hydrolase [Chloroflexota bacterium]